uniref:uncharacterized protein LOC122589584 n=1 Tax=Erigeron canadensis TaxID=72917 RepID=UPI001CB9AD76|nr:uncharacterized protein LOC122589584 [Erigeron canadensis]
MLKRMKPTSWNNEVTPPPPPPIINQQHHISIIPTASSRPQPLNLPWRDLPINATGEDYNETCLPLYKASMEGNLEAARVILDNHPHAIRFSLTENNDKLLHIAVLGSESKPFVEYLMTIMSKEDLELQNKNGETALCIAAITGNVEIARILVTKNDRLPHIPDNEGKTPLYIAALYRKEPMVNFLYEASDQMTGEFWTQETRGSVLVKCVEANLFDAALKMVNEDEELVKNKSVLGQLARYPEALYVKRPGIIKRFISSFLAICHWKNIFPDEDSQAMQLLKTILNKMEKLSKDDFDAIIKGPPDDETNQDERSIVYLQDTQEALHLLRAISENIVKMPAKFFSLFRTQPADEKPTPLKDIKPKYSSRVLFLAAEVGNTAFVVEVIRKYPHLVLQVNDDNQSIFHVAVSYGREGVYKLLKEIGPSKDIVIALEDKNGNNMLHIVGEKAKNNQVQNIRGVGLRLNPEIFWFKEIEKMIPLHLQNKKNAEGLTPHRVFIKIHKDQFSKCEEWMKDIASQLMVVAALVATTSYQVVFNPPGGYDDTGVPKFITLIPFNAFLISNCVSLVFSTTSILMVLSILASNYEEYDFMIPLSKQLMICLATVFISIASMIITFLINFFCVYIDFYYWIPSTFTVCAAIPFVIFCVSKYDVLGHFIRGYRMLYQTNVSTTKLHLK